MNNTVFLTRHVAHDVFCKDFVSMSPVSQDDTFNADPYKWHSTDLGLFNPPEGYKIEEMDWGFAIFDKFDKYAAGENHSIFWSDAKGLPYFYGDRGEHVCFNKKGN